MRRGLTAVFGALLVVGLVVYHQFDNELRVHIEQFFSKQYPGLRVEVQSARFRAGEGVEIRGLRFSEPGTTEPMIEVDEMFFAADAQLLDLVNGLPPINRVTIQRPVWRAHRNLEGKWNLAKLLPLPRLSAHPPPMTIEGGRLEITDENHQGASVTLRDVALEITSVDQAATDGSPRRLARVQGTLAGAMLEQASVEAVIDAESGACEVSGDFQQLLIGAEFCRWSTFKAAQELAETDSVRATSTGRFQLRYDPTQLPALAYQVDGTIERGRLEHPRFPYKFINLRGKYALSHLGLHIEQLVAESGNTKLRASLQRDGHTAESPLHLTLQASQLALNRSLYDALPDAWQIEWQRFMPTGTLDISAQVTFDGSAWRPQITADCHDLAFAYHKFSYRLTRGQGTIELRDNILSSNLTTSADGAQVRIMSQTLLAEPYDTGWVDVQAEALRFDDKLVKALPKGGGDAIRILRPGGTFNLHLRQWREDPHDAKGHLSADIMLQDCTMSLEHFAYPLRSVGGTVYYRDGLWAFDDLSGMNDSGRVTCTGRLTPHASGLEMLVNVRGQNIPLEDELRDALSPEARHFWQVLKPRGAVHLEAQVRRTQGDPKTHLWMRVVPALERVLVEPEFFPYRWENLCGAFVYSDGQLWLEDVRASHGDTTISLHGHGILGGEAGWEVLLDRVHVDRLRTDRDLIQALRGPLKKSVADARVEGQVGLRGAIRLACGGADTSLVTADWNVDVDLHQNSLRTGPKLENIHGAIKLVGAYDGQRFHSRGELAIDSLTVNNLQVTQLQGPFYVDEQRILFGNWASSDRNSQRPQRHITCQSYGGGLAADGWLQLAGEPHYYLTAELRGGDLQRLTHEALPGRQMLRGNVLANLELRGVGSSVHQLSGAGSVQLREADIYQLPIMMSLLKVLSVRQPDATAFDKSDVEFRIAGDHIYLDRIDFNGDAISLLGKGELDFERNMRLTFHPVVGRDETRLPWVSQMLGGAGQQVMLIHAEGPIEDPVMRREAFPGVTQALQQLQAEFQTPEARR